MRVNRVSKSKDIFIIYAFVFGACHKRLTFEYNKFAFWILSIKGKIGRKAFEYNIHQNISNPYFRFRTNLLPTLSLNIFYDGIFQSIVLVLYELDFYSY